MSHKSFTMIYYHIPQDLDDPDQPNAYTIPLNIKDITYTDIIKTFPIKGQFDFKFLCIHQKEQYWLDIKSNATQLPIVNKHIHVRAERIIKTETLSQNNSNSQIANNYLFDLS